MEIFLLISRPQGGFTPIRVICAISGDSNGLCGGSKEFQRVYQLSEALIDAGISVEEAEPSLQTLSKGGTTFLSVSIEAAQKMGLLEQVPKQTTVD